MTTTNNHRHTYIFASQFRSGVCVSIAVRIPPPGGFEDTPIHWSRPPSLRDRREHEKFKALVQDQLFKISGRPHFIEDLIPPENMFRPAKRKTKKTA